MVRPNSRLAAPSVHYTQWSLVHLYDSCVQSYTHTSVSSSEILLSSLSFIYSAWVLYIFCAGLLLRPLHFCAVWFMCAWFSFFGTEPSDWLGRTSPKWPVMCRLGRRIVTQSLNLELRITSVISAAGLSTCCFLCCYFHTCQSPSVSTCLCNTGCYADLKIVEYWPNSVC